MTPETEFQRSSSRRRLMPSVVAQSCCRC